MVKMSYITITIAGKFNKLLALEAVVAVVVVVDAAAASSAVVVVAAAVAIAVDVAVVAVAVFNITKGFKTVTS